MIHHALHAAFTPALQVPPPHRRDSRFVTWSPDSKHVLYVHREKAELPFQLWILPLDGGPARSLGPLPGYSLVNHHVALHPKGHELTYMQGKFGSRLYMLENFLR